MSNANWLSSAGLLNRDSESLAELAGNQSKDRRGTFCNSGCAIGTIKKTGILIHLGREFLKTCPNCGSDNLYFDSVTPRVAKEFEARKKKQIAKRRKEKIH